MRSCGFHFPQVRAADDARRPASRTSLAVQLVQDDVVMWLADPTPTPTPSAGLILGFEPAAWTAITGTGALVATFISIIVAVYTLKAADRREHHRWLQEKRREAYAAFLTVTRDEYEAIEGRGRIAQAPRISSDHRRPGTPKIVDATALIERKDSELKRAKDILGIVGPEKMEDLGDRLIARLKLDRVYYSPTGYTQREKNKEKILQYAEETREEAFFSQLHEAIAGRRVDFEQYKAAHDSYRLEAFWIAFTEAARRVLSDPSPESRLRRWWNRMKGRWRP